MENILIKQGEEFNLNIISQDGEHSIDGVFILTNAEIVYPDNFNQLNT